MPSFSEALVTVKSHNRYGAGNILHTYKQGSHSTVGHLPVCSGGRGGLRGWKSRLPQEQAAVGIMWDKQVGFQLTQVRAAKGRPEITGRDLGWQGEVSVVQLSAVSR